MTGVLGKNQISSLDGAAPLERLKALLEASESAEEAKLLAENLLVGVKPAGGDDFLVRQVLAASREGHLVIGDAVKIGEKVRFHVRDAAAARDDLAAIAGRYALERAFGGLAGHPLLSVVVSCAGRGEGLFGETGVDAEAFYEGVGAPVVGFFANGEIGPVGARVPSANATMPAYLHGFTATAAVLYDTGGD